VKLTTHIYLILSLRIHGVKLHSSTHVHVVVQTSSVYHPVKWLYFEEIDVLIRLRAGGSSFRIPAGIRNCYLLQNVRITSEAQLASCSVGTCGYFLGRKMAAAWSWLHHHLVSRLRMNWAILLLDGLWLQIICGGKQIWKDCCLFWLKGCNTICGINRNSDINRDQRLPGPNTAT
jgi:hypothetical protein